MFALLFLFAFVANAQNTTMLPYIPFTDWNTLLNTTGVITSGVIEEVHLNIVNYSMVASSPLLNLSLAFIAQTFATTTFTEAEFLSFWINVYNILAVNRIVTNPCERDLFGACRLLPSIRSSTSQLESVWDVQSGIVNGQPMSFNDVLDILRSPTEHGYAFDEDPRIFSALTSASISAPDLLPHSYEPAAIDVLLNVTMHAWLENTDKGMMLDTTNKVIQLSSIFNSYPADFNNDFLSFITNYTTATQANFVIQNKLQLTVSFFDWDWDINGVGLQCAVSRPCFTALDMLITGLVVGVFVVVMVIVCIVQRRRMAKRLYQSL